LQEGAYKKAVVGPCVRLLAAHRPTSAFLSCKEFNKQVLRLVQIEEKYQETQEGAFILLVLFARVPCKGYDINIRYSI